MIDAFGSCSLLQCFELAGLQGNLYHRTTLKDRFADLLKLIFEISQIMRVPEASQFCN